MEYFMKKYMAKNSNVLDVGGSYKYCAYDKTYHDIVKSMDSDYKNLDWASSDYNVQGYDWSPVPKDCFNVVISGQTLEHDLFFWKTLENMRSVLMKGGLVMIIVQTKGKFHQHPYDCYRFYPDSAHSFAHILGADIVEVVWNSSMALEAIQQGRMNRGIIFNHQQDTNWGDLGMVFRIN